MEHKVFKKVVYKRESSYMSAITFFALIGTIFSGYLSYQKLFSNVCPLTEGCALLFGLPTCVYGFVLFFLTFILALSGMTSRIHFSQAIRFISLVAVLFTGYYAIYDLFFAPLNLLNGAVFTLFLPSCVYGFILFLTIYILS